MSDTPDGEANKPETGKPGKGRPRPQPVVDLPAEAVTDISPPAEPPAEMPPETAKAAPPESADEPVVPPMPAAEPPLSPPQPAAPSRLVPALVGLVAGLAGGVAAAQLGPVLFGAAPTTDPALVGRVAQLEQQARAVRPTDAVGPRLDSLLAELPKREAALKAEIASLRQALESRPAALASQMPVPNPGPELEALKTRLGTLEDGLKAVPQGVGQIGARVDGLQPRVETIARDLQGLASRVNGLGARDSLAAANARLAAVTLAEDAFSQNRPLGPALDLLKGVLPDAAALAPLQPFAEAGAETPAALLAALKAAAPKPVAAETSLTWQERLRQSAAAFIEIRKTGDVSGVDDQSAVKRAELALQRGDVSAALAATARLSPAAAPAYAAWRGLLERQVKAREALVQLRQEAMTFLARTAQAAK